MDNNLWIRNVAGLPDVVDIGLDLLPPEDLDYYHFTTKCMFNSMRRDGYIGLPVIAAYLVDGEMGSSTTSRMGGGKEKEIRTPGMLNINADACYTSNNIICFDYNSNTFWLKTADGEGNEKIYKYRFEECT